MFPETLHTVDILWSAFRKGSFQEFKSHFLGDFRGNDSLEWVRVVTSRRSRWQMFFKYCFSQNFAKFTGKHLCQNLFFKWGCRRHLRFCELFKSIFLTERLLTTISVSLIFHLLLLLITFQGSYLVPVKIKF